MQNNSSSKRIRLGAFFYTAILTKFYPINNLYQYFPPNFDNPRHQPALIRHYGTQIENFRQNTFVDTFSAAI